MRSEDGFEYNAARRTTGAGNPAVADSRFVIDASRRKGFIVDEWATLDELRDDIRKRAGQILSIGRRILEIGRALDAMSSQISQLEEESGLKPKKRGRRRRPGSAPKGPTVVDGAVEILRERGTPMPCVEIARILRARGIDSGNNERSLRMSAGKGRRLRSLPGDVISLT